MKEWLNEVAQIRGLGFVFIGTGKTPAVVFTID